MHDFISAQLCYYGGLTSMRIFLYFILFFFLFFFLLCVCVKIAKMKMSHALAGVSCYNGTCLKSRGCATSGTISDSALCVIEINCH